MLCRKFSNDFEQKTIIQKANIRQQIQQKQKQNNKKNKNQYNFTLCMLLIYVQ